MSIIGIFKRLIKIIYCFYFKHHESDLKIIYLHDHDLILKITCFGDLILVFKIIKVGDIASLGRMIYLCELYLNKCFICVKLLQKRMRRMRKMRILMKSVVNCWHNKICENIFSHMMMKCGTLNIRLYLYK